MSQLLLAQRVVEFPFELWRTRAHVDPGPAYLVSRCVENLRIPWEGGNHVPLPHRALGPVYAAEAESKSVAIYHFDADSYAAADAIGSTAHRRQVMAQSARSPGPRCFFEWPHREQDTGRYGLYVDGDRDGAVFILWVEHKDRPPLPAIACRFKLASDGRCSLARPLPLFPNASDRGPDDGVHWINNIIAFWTFLASQGAVVISREPAPRGSGKEYRSKGHGAAILSFNRVRLLLPKGLIARTGRVEWQQNSGMRRHEVRAHPSYYWVGPREQRSLVVRWIAAYWRGNSRVGLVLKARDVETKGGSK